MLRTHTCVTAECDRCGHACWNLWDYQPHWDSETAALVGLESHGWRVDDTRPPRMLCPRCAAATRGTTTTTTGAPAAP
ncbi:MAG: hypothetical protein ACRD0V_18655 [Acidimicrobiales bacterium]